MRSSVLLSILLAGTALGCGDDSGRPNAEEADASDSGHESPGPADGGREPVDDAASAPALAEDAAEPVETDAAAPELELPADSREFDDVLNLVDEAAAAQLESFILSETPVFVTKRHGLTNSVNLFLAHYREEYDFLYFVTDHVISSGSRIGVFEAVTRPAAAGGTSEFEIQASEYTTSGRLKGVVALRYRPGIFPPVAHETLHYWGNDLDPRLGFGANEFASHWGLTSVDGVLGGFDASTLHCKTPAGAVPPACSPLPSGRVRYVIGAFHGNDNTARGLPYAPLELYLMGLIPGSQVPPSFQILEGGQYDDTSFDAQRETVEVEADRIREVTFAEIVARHGSVPLLAEEQRQFKGAFVVVSAEPAPDDVLREVARWSATFGGRGGAAGVLSFEETAGRLASMDTRLGPRRRTDETPLSPRKPLTCDILAQDCPRPELRCSDATPPLCALSGGIERGEPCDAPFACAPGLECMRSGSNPSAYFCEPYCAPESGADKSCATLCEGPYVTFTDTQGAVVSAACKPD